MAVDGSGMLDPVTIIWPFSILGENIFWDGCQKVRDQEGRILVEVAVVEDEQELATVPLQSLERVEDAAREGPDLALLSSAAACLVPTSVAVALPANAAALVRKSRRLKLDIGRLLLGREPGT